VEFPANRPSKDETLGLFAGLPRRYDLAGAVLSFGQDPRWRRAMVGEVRARRDQRVLDVATGTGMVAGALVRRYGCRVVGLDQSAEMLSGARAKLDADAGLRGELRSAFWFADQHDADPEAGQPERHHHRPADPMVDPRALVLGGEDGQRHADHQGDDQRVDQQGQRDPDVAADD